MKKILISACFLGEKVRYDGNSNPLTNPLIATWIKQQRLVVICPEVCGGLPVPRDPAEINQTTKKVFTQKGLDVSEHFALGAKRALALCKKHQITFALLKESSPSCGSYWVYDGNFSQQKIAGQGITTQLLLKNGIQVFSEENIEQLSANLLSG